MKYFKLPDLGEGLQEAEIVEWHIKPGDPVETGQTLVSVETAKAIVDIPAPQDGIIAACFGKEGDLIHTGEPLLEFQGEEQEDSGTVVGKMETSQAGSEREQFIIGSAYKAAPAVPLATPAIRALAKRLKVDINHITGTGNHHMITSDDVERAARLTEDLGEATPLRGVRRSMARNMAKAHAEVVKVTIQDDVDVEHWQQGEDITMRLVRAMGRACTQEPTLNAWYDNENDSLRLIEKVDLGIAVDTPDGLFVPVLRNITTRTQDDLRDGLTRIRADVKKRTIPPREMSGATITLSNYGTIAGRYGNPVVMPPMVAILGAGKIYPCVISHADGFASHRFMPLSLSFDHRVVTGGEAARFLRAVMDDLAE
ncbi:2-oxo acid dehydrogenase subunit E2 [Ketobacter sp. MCCC 1A13808]|uniref:dihydrolipoamide acetyltransferase family protein n=1 Tax=Ketobacter sp. MCCC 1A13808 TaxID=2602738 RepID=UPI0012EB384E|nr:dihydrolipoamide acetyltransferase family protein [Ketobacter sp. MCCC 1A13808]MVF14664.1 2-oxo acid dehydrogenase subunit E2 [Ketobacter sp. MCCC 1A13808]